jgi:hypothetical protein
MPQLTHSSWAGVALQHLAGDVTSPTMHFNLTAQSHFRSTSVEARVVACPATDCSGMLLNWTSPLSNRQWRWYFFPP